MRIWANRKQSELDVDVIVMACGAAALEAEFGVREVEACGERGFDEDLGDAWIGGEEVDEGCSADRVHGAVGPEGLEGGKIPAQGQAGCGAGRGVESFKGEVAEGGAGLAGQIGVGGGGVIKGEVELFAVIMGEMGEEGEACEERKAAIEGEGDGAGVGGGHLGGSVLGDIAEVWGDVVTHERAVEGGLHAQGFTKAGQGGAGAGGKGERPEGGVGDEEHGQAAAETQGDEPRDAAQLGDKRKCDD